MPKVFLDKIVTSAHVPPSQGSRKYISTTTFPDLSHTMISTKFCPVLPSAMTPNGEMTRTYKHHAFRLYQTCERPSAELKMKVKFFKRAHHVFANKILLDLEQMKITRNERRQKIWTQGKKDLGFESMDSFVGIESSVEGFRPFPGDAERAATASHGSNSFTPAQSQSTFFLLPSDGRLGDESFAYGGDDFEVAEDYNPSVVETKFPADAFGDEYGSEAFELSTPVLTAVMPTDAPHRPATSAMQSSSIGSRAMNHTTPGPHAVTFRSGDGNSPLSPPQSSSSSSSAADDKRVGMQGRLQAKNNALIAEEEAKFKRTQDSLTDIAIKAVGRVGHVGGAAKSRASSLSSANSSDTAPLTSPTAQIGVESNTANVHKGKEGGGIATSDENHKSMVVAFDVPSVAMTTTSRSRDKLSTSQRQQDGISPPRVRGAFSRETYFECLFDTMDIPQPHAARFGMMQSPKCKTSAERHAQRRAQTAEFVPRMTKSLDNMPERGASARPVEAGMTVETSLGEQPIAGRETARASPIQVDPPHRLRRLSKGSLKDVLGRLATASQSERSPKSAIPRSPISKGELIPSPKWREDAMERAITGDKYGEYKIRAYR
jgi:hypothetical protein